MNFDITPIKLHVHACQSFCQTELRQETYV